jgi:hypothetical protein
MKTTGMLVAMALACTLQQGRAADDLEAGGSGTASYVSGGVGAEERDAMAARRGEFNLYVTFARRGGGEMLAGIALGITDRQRHPVLTADGVGPQVFVKLPPGTYWVNATFDGQEQSRSVTVDGKGGREVTFHWGPARQAEVR